MLRREVEALPVGSWVVIDEVQRVPAILNEIHDLIARHDQRYRFALSGSSARKLRRVDANLLAGRVIDRKMFPLVESEYNGRWTIDEALKLGSLPLVVTHSDAAVDILVSYVATYLQQEIRQEALVADLASFQRFLKVMGIMNGEQLNASAVSRDTGVSRATVDRYLDVLEDTLIAFRLSGWQPRARVKEQTAPRYYFFDCGVARALTGRIYTPVSDLELGKLLETYVLHELRAAMSYKNIGGELSYWRSSGGAKIDFVWSRGDRAIGFEVKASTKWRRGYGSALIDLMAAKKIDAGYVVYRGEHPISENGVLGLPLNEFLIKIQSDELWNG